MKCGERKAQVFHALEQGGAQGRAVDDVADLIGKTPCWLYAYLAYFEDRRFIWRRRIGGRMHFVLATVCPPIEGEALEKRHYEHRSVKASPAEEGEPRVFAALAVLQPPEPPRKAWPRVQVHRLVDDDELPQEEAPRPAPRRSQGERQLVMRPPRPKPLEVALKRAGLMPQSAAAVIENRAPARKAAEPVEVIIPAHVKVQRCPGLNHDPRYQVDPAKFGGGELDEDWRCRRAGARRAK